MSWTGHGPKSSATVKSAGRTAASSAPRRSSRCAATAPTAAQMLRAAHVFSRRSEERESNTLTDTSG